MINNSMSFFHTSIIPYTTALVNVCSVFYVKFSNLPKSIIIIVLHLYCRRDNVINSIIIREGEKSMNDKTRYEILRQREMMKAYTAADVGTEPTDQQQKLPAPAPVKSGKGGMKIPLPLDFENIVQDKNLFALLAERESCRVYREEEISLKELSFLLWATQGIRHFAGKMKQVTFRNVPSAGSRHPFETYLFINKAEGLTPGIYHYIPTDHTLELWEDYPDYEEELTDALCGQEFAGAAPVTFVWSVIPYRSEWRYGRKSHKYMLIDAGHVCENLYLACESIGCGTCAIGAYDQDKLDELLGFITGPSAETDNEFAVYAASVGKKREPSPK